MMNINKFIASSGLCSRRKADILVKAGKVKINDKIAALTDKISKKDIVKVDGKIIKPSTKKIYIAFNKPVGVICTTDKDARDNIMSFIKIPERVFPVGRLDVKSSGLILLTNDGDFAQKILKSKKIEKEYVVEVHKNFDENFLKRMQKPFIIDGYPTLPAKINKLSGKVFSIIIKEGRKRQIRRMCEKLHYEALKLQRVRIGDITLDNLKEKEYKLLSEEQIDKYNS